MKSVMNSWSRSGWWLLVLLSALSLWVQLVRAGGAILPLEQAPRQDPELIALGKDLFHDRRFSRDDSISCASCHPLERGGADGMRFSVGVEGRLGAINAPTVYNSAFHISYFWDGRAATLEALVLDGPLQNPVELDSSWEQLLPKLRQDESLRRRFRTLFDDGLTRRNVAHAIATFLRSLVTTESPFDRWLAGEKEALSAQAKRGYRLFRSYGCIACHQGRNVGGNMYATMGIMGDYFKDRGTEITRSDLGRYNVTGRESDRHLFKVPSLRLAALTPPYFHDGTAATLDEAVRIMGRYQLGRDIPAEERADIVAFLKSLVGRHPLMEPAP